MSTLKYRNSQFSQAGLPDWQLELINQYPLIYLELEESNLPYYLKSGDNKFDVTDYCNLRQGFEFKQGWAKLADDFSSVVTDLVIHLRATMQPDAYIHASIFKEKFGRLRWQGCTNLTGLFKVLYKAYIDRIADQSTFICEITDRKSVV